MLTDLSSVKFNKAELHSFVDTVRHALAGLLHTHQYDLPSFLTSMLVPCIPKPLQVEWEVHSRESKDVPPVEEFLEFVLFRADILSSQPTAAKAPEPQPRPTDKTDHPSRRYKAAIHTTTLCSHHPTDPMVASGMNVSFVQAVSTLCFSAQYLTE